MCCHGVRELRRLHHVKGIPIEGRIGVLRAVNPNASNRDDQQSKDCINEGQPFANVQIAQHGLNRS